MHKRKAMYDLECSFNKYIWWEMIENVESSWNMKKSFQLF